MFLRNSKGAAAVEFAIIFPLLLIITFGIIESSLILYDKAMITNAAREAARTWVVWRGDAAPDPGQTDIQAAVNNYLRTADGSLRLYSLRDTSTLTIPPPQFGTVPTSGDRTLIVTVNYRYDFLIFPDLTKFFGSGDFSNIQLSSVTVMRMEG